MPTEQIAVRLSRESLARVDDLVTRGVYESRAAVVRAGIDAVAERERAERLEHEWREGYARIAPTAGERDAALASLRDAILEEPW